MSWLILILTELGIGFHPLQLTLVDSSHGIVMIIADGKMPEISEASTDSTWYDLGGTIETIVASGLAPGVSAALQENLCLSHQRVVSLLLRDFQLTKSGCKTPAWSFSCMIPCILQVLPMFSTNRLVYDYNMHGTKKLRRASKCRVFFDVLCCVCFRGGYSLCLNEGSAIMYIYIYMYLTMFISVWVMWYFNLLYTYLYDTLMLLHNIFLRVCQWSHHDSHNDDKGRHTNIKAGSRNRD